MSQDMVKIFKALSNQTRMDIVFQLLGSKELSCRQLLRRFRLSQPTLSHHFNELIDAEILRVRKEGASHFYSINNQYLKSLGINMQKIVGGERQ